MSDNPFERIEVVVSGKEKLTARPIEFEEVDGVPVRAIRYETTCPICGGMVHFAPEDVIEGYIDCECLGQRPEPRRSPVIQQPAIEIRVVGQRTMLQQEPEPACPFVDPVELGDFDPTRVDYE